MLSVLKRWKQYYIREVEIPDNEWFDIWLFKTKLRFQMPAPTAPKRDPMFTNIDSNPDLRPFVNTESRQLYRRTEALGYYGVSIYSAGWLFKSQWFKTKAHTELRFDLSGYAVTDSDFLYYPDILHDDIALAWLRNHYLKRGPIHLQKHDDPSMELLNPPENQARNNLVIKLIQINKHSMFKVQITPDLITYWVPFSQRDFIRFDFKTITLSKIEKDEKKRTRADAHRLTKAIISSTELLYDPTISKLSYLHLTDQ